MPLMEGQDLSTSTSANRLAPARRLILTVAILITAVWLLLTPGGLLGKADAVGYAVCHRIDLRSFHLGERTLPLCSRCTGMYLGSLFTLLAYMLFRGKAGLYPSRAMQIVLIGFGVVWALDGINSTLTLLPGAGPLYEPQNWLRMVTGMLIGVSLTTMIYPVFVQSAFFEWHKSAIIPSWRWFAGLLAFLALIVLGLLSQNPLILYPLALLSSLGVLALLTMAYSVLTLALFKLQNRISNLRQLWFPLLTGFMLSLVQVGAIDLLRYLLTGTWDGFHL